MSNITDTIASTHLGKKSEGNSNYDHIGDYHSMRLLCIDILMQNNLMWLC